MLFITTTGVALVRSPRYLAEKIADAVDERLPRVRDEAKFWKSVQRAWELAPAELPALQARIAGKYCRNLDIWQALPRLRRRGRVVLLHAGPRIIFECWRKAYGFEAAFDEVLLGQPGLIAGDAALYAWAAEQEGSAPADCVVVEATRVGVEAALTAGLHAYRYGTAYGLERWLDERGYTDY